MDGKGLNKYVVKVLGCKVNQYDARQIEHLLENYSLEPAVRTDDSDIVVVHTCAVTAAAAQKSRQTIRKIQRDNPLAQIIVTGCAADVELTQVDQLPVIRVQAGADWLQRLAGQLDLLIQPPAALAESIATNDFPVSSFGDHTRAFLKVQDGCDIGCSFCIIPQLRKEPRDKGIAAAVAEATQLTRQGYREIVVTGVSVGLYGRDGGSSLAELLRHLAEIPDIGRIRMSSLHPGELTDELLEVWSSSPSIMPHLHLSLQSGSEAVLRAMRRGYTAGEYHDAVLRARDALDNPAFTTDVIVGFPGETDEYFEESYEFCKTVGFSQMHIFTYSPRPNTIAAKMGRQVNGAVASRRSERLHELGRRMAASFHKGFLGKEVEMLVEQSGGGVSMGYSSHYVPVEVESREYLRRQRIGVKITGSSAEGISGEISALPAKASP